MQYNATSDSDSIVCVFPISGQYAILNRVLLYLMLALGIVAFIRRWLWVALATWAYVMTYAASTTIHMIVMAATTKRGFYNLDMVGAWAIISACSLVAVPMTSLSSRLRDSHYRLIFGLWGTMVSAAGYAFWLKFDDDYPLEPACRSNNRSSNGTLLVSKTQLLLSEQFDCTYKCFDASYPTRDSSEITVIMAERAFGHLFKILVGGICTTVVLTLMFGMFLFCCGTHRRKTRQELQTIIREPSPGLTTDADIITAHYNRVREAREELDTGKVAPDGNVLALFCPLALPIVIAFNEAYIAGKESSLPVSEHPYEVGQWAPWVSMWITLIAAAINNSYKPRWHELQEEWQSHDQAIRGRQTNPGERDIEMSGQGGRIEASEAVQQPQRAHLNRSSPPNIDQERGH